MAEKLQSKVKLRSGEVVTVDHVKPEKKTTSDKPKETPKPKADKPADEKQTTTSNDKPKETK